MITLDQYKEAVKIIVAFHEQTVNTVPRDVMKMESGDCIVFTKIIRTSKYLTIGKSYKIQNVYAQYGDSYRAFTFYDDRKKSKVLRTNTNGYDFQFIPKLTNQ